MAAARNVSAAARMTERPSAGVAAGELADRRRLAGPVDADDEHDRRAAGDRRARAPVEVARDEQRGELGADGRLGAARVASRAGPLDDVDRQGGADVAGDERLLDVVPRRASPARPEEAAQPGHEAAAGPLEAGVEARASGAAGDAARGRCRRPALARSGSAGRRRRAAGLGRAPDRAARARTARQRVGRLGIGSARRSAVGPGRRSRPGRAPSRARPPRVDRLVDLGRGRFVVGRRRQKGMRRSLSPPRRARRDRASASACASSSRRLITRLTESSPTVTP